MWPKFVTPRYEMSFCMIMDHFWSLSLLRGSLTLKWSNMTERAKTAQEGSAGINMALTYHISTL